MRFAPDDDMIETLTPDRSDQPFHKAILPGRGRCGRLVPDAHGAQSKPIVGITNRSMAAMSGAWLRKKVRHPWLGGPRRLTMYLATLDCAIANPSLSSSP